MHNIIYSTQANKDIEDIRKFIANKVIEKLFFFINTLSLFPLIWKEISEKLWYREITEPTFRYTIIYEIDWNNVYIMSIFKYKNTQT